MFVYLQHKKTSKGLTHMDLHLAEPHTIILRSTFLCSRYMPSHVDGISSFLTLVVSVRLQVLCNISHYKMSKHLHEIARKTPPLQLTSRLSTPLTLQIPLGNCSYSSTVLFDVKTRYWDHSPFCNTCRATGAFGEMCTCGGINDKL